MILNTLIAIGAFVLAISLLVAVHEWGHYIAARWSGVKVLEYSIGFGPSLWRRKSGPDATEYHVRALPIGGYVRLLDEREGPVADQELHRSFTRQPYWSRIFILGAGPGMNFLFAIAAYWLIFMVGVQALAPVVASVAPGSAAEQAGLRQGDRIVAVQDRESPSWQAVVLGVVDQILGDSSVQVTVEDDQGVRRSAALDLAGQQAAILETGDFFGAVGVEPLTAALPIVGEVQLQGPAERAGLLPGDRILTAGGQEISTWQQWYEYVRQRPGETAPVTVDRGGQERRLLVEIGSRQDPPPEGASGPVTVGFVGVGRSPDATAHLFVTQRFGPLAALLRGVTETWRITGLTFRVLGNMFTGDVSLRTLSGPVGIARYAGAAARMSSVAFIQFLALVSVSLGILNLLPIPILDGGQMVSQTIEQLRGRPIPQRTQLAVQRIGLGLVLAIMFVALFNDISGLFRMGG